jgi:hypothetical protein
MRTHGDPKFPDLTITADGQHIGFPQGIEIDPNSPAFTAAVAACNGNLNGKYGERLLGKLTGKGGK